MISDEYLFMFLRALFMYVDVCCLCILDINPLLVISFEIFSPIQRNLYFTLTAVESTWCSKRNSGVGSLVSYILALDLAAD